MGVAKVWTAERVETLKNLYASMPTKELAAMLGVSERAVFAKANAIGLKKSADYIAKTLSDLGKKLQGKSKGTRFKKGQIPHNKGVPMTIELYEKCSVSFFKKGQISHTLKPLGYERTGKDGYIEVKTAKGFKPKQRYIWEQINGEVPKSHVVIFEDGDKYNFDIDNLRLISRKESLARNRFIASPELKEAMKLLNEIQKFIYNAEK